MRFEALGAGESRNRRSKGCQRPLFELLYRYDLHVIGGGQASADSRDTAGGQNVIRTRSIIAGGFRAEGADEDAAGVFDLRQQLFMVGAEVLRRESIRKLRGFFQRANQNDGAVFINRCTRKRQR